MDIPAILPRAPVFLRAQLIWPECSDFLPRGEVRLERNDSRETLARLYEAFSSPFEVQSSNWPFATAVLKRSASIGATQCSRMSVKLEQPPATKSEVAERTKSPEQKIVWRGFSRAKLAAAPSSSSW